MGLYSIFDCRRLVDGLDHPECVVVGDDGLLYAGGEAGQVYRIDGESGAATQIAEVGGFVAGLTPCGDGSLLVCDVGGGRLLRLGRDLTVETILSGISFPNFAVFDAAGTIYLTDSGDYYRKDGRLIKVGLDGGVEILVATGLGYPNGLVIDPAGDWLYLAESTGGRILRYRLGEPSWAEPEVYAPLEGLVPDGLAMSDTGHIYVGCYAPDTILRVAPDRSVTTLVADPGGDMLNRPTNLAFQGTTLLFANLGGYHIGALEVGEGGAPLHRPLSPDR